MGIVKLGGSEYSGYYGTVFWSRLALRSSNNASVLGRASVLLDIVSRLLDPSPDHVQPPANIAWCDDSDGRVMAWNGGPSDIP